LYETHIHTFDHFNYTVIAAPKPNPNLLHMHRAKRVLAADGITLHNVAKEVVMTTWQLKVRLRLCGSDGVTCDFS
jgi:hypothetical protein